MSKFDRGREKKKTKTIQAMQALQTIAYLVYRKEQKIEEKRLHAYLHCCQTAENSAILLKSSGTAIV